MGNLHLPNHKNKNQIKIEIVKKICSNCLICQTLSSNSLISTIPCFFLLHDCDISHGFGLPHQTLHLFNYSSSSCNYYITYMQFSSLPVNALNLKSCCRNLSIKLTWNNTQKQVPFSIKFTCAFIHLALCSSSSS